MAENHSNKKYSSYDAMIGQPFGRLTVLGVIRTKWKNTRLECLCVCGTLTTPFAAGVKSGDTQSCGCYQKDRCSESHLTHGENGKTSAEYRAWRNIYNRTNNPNIPRYSEWGGSGVTMNSEWQGKGGYEKFLAYVGRRPTPQHSIDRYPNRRGNYEPGNVRWATPYEQALNRDSTQWITWQGETLCVADWCRRLRISRHALENRLEKLPLEKAMTKPINSKRGNKYMQPLNHSDLPR